MRAAQSSRLPPWLFPPPSPYQARKAAPWIRLRRPSCRSKREAAGNCPAWIRLRSRTQREGNPPGLLPASPAASDPAPGFLCTMFCIIVPDNLFKKLFSLPFSPAPPSLPPSVLPGLLPAFLIILRLPGSRCAPPRPFHASREAEREARAASAVYTPAVCVQRELVPLLSAV